MADQYSIALQNALNQANSSKASIANQQQGINNTYQDLMDTLAKRKSDATNLKNTQLAAGELNYNNQRDQAVTGANTAMSNDRDWLANHGIANSNENADQMGRLNTKLNNSLSGVNVAKNTYNNANNASFNSSMGDINIANAAGLRARDTSNKGIANSYHDIDQTYNSTVQNIRMQQAAAVAQAQARAVSVQRAAAAKKAKAVESASNDLSSQKANVDELVSGNYNLSEKQRTINSYLNSLGASDVTMKNYAKNALNKINTQMVQWNNSQRYAGMASQNYQG